MKIKMSEKRVECPICNTPHFHSVSYTDRGSFIIHMSREHNWPARDSMIFFKDKKQDGIL